MTTLPDPVEPAPDDSLDPAPVSPLVTLGENTAPVCADGVCAL
ncbi:hypothetical protein [Nonomuraea turkmeniaca]|nr:hypothetical protein [Nonomuraea turkmeniaca]